MSKRTERLKLPLILAALVVMSLKVCILLWLDRRFRNFPASEEKE
jgi:hypothetical protein